MHHIHTVDRNKTAVTWWINNVFVHTYVYFPNELDLSHLYTDLSVPGHGYLFVQGIIKPLDFKIQFYTVDPSQADVSHAIIDR